MSITDNLILVKKQIAEACARVMRDPSEVTLVAVSKQHPIADILEAYTAGQRHFGENRIEEMREKYPQIPHHDITWHMVGHIQSRKARDIPPYFNVVHSVDSLSLAQKLSSATEKSQKAVLDVLLQINISGEESKSGFFAVDWKRNTDVRAELWNNIREILVLPYIQVMGLMTMAFIADNPEQIRPVFAGLRDLRDALAGDFNIPLPHLSMGMTDDFRVGIEEGATIVRVGRAIFGER